VWFAKFKRIATNDNLKYESLQRDPKAQAVVDHMGGGTRCADPGQGLPMFDGDDLRTFIEQATWVAVNDYEAQMLQERTGWSAEEIAGHVKALIVTRGAEGSLIYADSDVIEIPAVEAVEVLDPTGCGDSYRAGLLYGLLNDLNWNDTGRLAALIGSIKIAHRGTQNHQFTPASLDDRFEAAFGYRLGL